MLLQLQCAKSCPSTTRTRLPNQLCPPEHRQNVSPRRLAPTEATIIGPISTSPTSSSALRFQIHFTGFLAPAPDLAVELVKILVEIDVAGALLAIAVSLEQ
jgi:hypothetical protein